MKPLTYLRVPALVLSLASVFGPCAALFAQDISGGSSAELARNSEVEGNSGRGVFTRPKEAAHHVRKVEKKTVARVNTPSRTQGTGGGGGGTSRTDGGGGTSNDQGTGLGNKPLGDGARRVAGAEDLKKQGDDLFDAGQYDKAVETYKKAISQKATFPEAYLNLSEAYFNLGRFEDAVEAAKQSIAQGGWADAYLALGNAYLKLDRPQDALEPLKIAQSLDPQNAEVKSALSLLYYDQGVDAYNANKYDEAIAAYQQAISIKYDL